MAGPPRPPARPRALPARRRRHLALGAALALALAGCGSSEPTISTTARSDLLDSPVTVRVTGLEPHENVELGASMTDDFGVRWASTTPLQADGEGRAGLGEHPMRFLELMEPDDPQALFAIPDPKLQIRLAVRRGSETLATSTLTRSTRARGVEATPVTVADDGFAGTHFTPPGHGEHPAVLLFGGAEGGDAATGIAALLASHGIEVQTLAYFGEKGVPRQLVRVPLEYFRRALMSLRERPGVDPDRIAIYGVSRGGEASLLVATTYPDLASRVVALVPSTFVQPADVNRHVSAWTLRGHPVPFGVTERIPVEDIPGPVFAVGAGADFSWPSDRFANDVRQQRPDRDDDVVLIYDTANHAVGIGMPYFPLGHEGGVPEADARADLWPKLVEFLGGH